MDKFQVGNTYQAICWFTGAMFTYQCVKRTDTEITFSSISEEVDGIHNMAALWTELIWHITATTA